jgi:deoxyribose-phosphate aldolase
MKELASFIEHSILRPDTTAADVKRVCEEAKKYQFAAVCVPPLYMRDARRALGDDSKVRVATVVGFPLGYSAIAAKSEEIKRAIDEGADDIDAVINLAALKSQNWNHVEHDIDSVARATHMRGRTLKLILECGMLQESDMKRLAELAATYKVSWVKTGTGFNGYDATPDMVKTLRAVTPDHIKIKASGGIKTAEQAKKILDAGADRIGTSSALAIIGA